jgi:hypothetical protein
MIFILSGAINNGWSGQFFAIPFWIFFIIILFNSTKKFSLISLTTLLIPYFIFSLDHKTNPILYPILGSQIELVGQWNYVVYSDSPHLKYLAPPSEKDFSWSAYKTHIKIVTPLTLELAGIDTSHADFGTQLIGIFRDKNGDTFRFYLNGLKRELSEGTITEDAGSGFKDNEYQSNFSQRLGLLMMWPLGVFLSR